MGLLDNIEKLINEHGSSAILREHLSLFKSQVIMLEKKALSLETENVVLKDKVKAFESQCENATKEIHRLNKIIEAFHENQGIKKLDKITEQILKLFFDAGRELSVSDFIRAMPMTTSTIEYHFDLLMENKFIIQSRVGIESSWTGENSPAMFELTPSGRKYVIENMNT